MSELIIIFLGGSIGAGLRYLVSLFATNYGLPYGGTFVVNIIGCLLLGFLVRLEFESENRTHNNFKLFLTTGIVSSFTTFSTFSYEAFNMIKNGDIQTGLLYMLSSLIFGMAAILIGFTIAKKLKLEIKETEVEERENIWAD